MKYRKKPVVIEAIQIPFRFSKNPSDYPDWFVDAINTEKIVVTRGMMTGEVRSVEIKTLEGTMHANVGDYIIKGIHNELYPCKPEIFEESYEMVETLTKEELEKC